MLLSRPPSVGRGERLCTLQVQRYERLRRESDLPPSESEHQDPLAFDACLAIVTRLDDLALSQDGQESVEFANLVTKLENALRDHAGDDALAKEMGDLAVACAGTLDVVKALAAPAPVALARDERAARKIARPDDADDGDTHSDDDEGADGTFGADGPFGDVGPFGLAGPADGQRFHLRGQLDEALDDAARRVNPDGLDMEFAGRLIRLGSDLTRRAQELDMPPNGLAWAPRECRDLSTKDGLVFEKDFPPPLISPDLEPSDVVLLATNRPQLEPNTVDSPLVRAAQLALKPGKDGVT